MGNAATQSIEAFIIENYDDVYRYLYSKVSSRVDAQDLTQEVFMRYVRNVGEQNVKAKGRPYLFTIAHNISIDHYRDKKPDPVQITPHLEETLADRHQDEKNFDETVESLPPDMRELLSLKYAQGFQMREIAEITGQSRFSVKRRIDQALDILKRTMDEGSS